MAFAKDVEAGEIVELTPEQAEALEPEALIAPYEVKVEKVPEVKKKATPSASSRRATASRKKTPKRSKKSAKKSS